MNRRDFLRGTAFVGAASAAAVLTGASVRDIYKILSTLV